ncbi:MAG: hypothetical protein R2822_23605 [Spirosomataceae bacterium]
MNTQSTIYNILIFKTNIKTEEDKHKIAPLLDALLSIRRWTVDCEDCDCVLRIESDNLTEDEIIKLIQQGGFTCEVLND